MSRILFSERLRDHDFTKHLAENCRRLVLVPHSSPSFDFGCGNSLVLLLDFRSLESTTHRTPVCSRIDDAQKLVTPRGAVVMLVWMNVSEPALEVLSWLNLDCGVARRCGVVLCWTVDEASQFVESLATASPLSISYRPGERAAALGDARTAAGATRPHGVDHSQRAVGNEESPFETIKTAFTQTPQFLTEADVVRIVNRHTTVADLLLSVSLDTVSGLPGVSLKKARRLQDVLHAPFHGSLPGVSDFLQHRGEEGPGEGLRVADSGHPSPPPCSGNELHGSNTSATLMDALRRIRAREDAEEDAD